MNTSVTFIGGGNMATALISGLIQKGLPPASIRVVEINADARARLAQEYGVATFGAVTAESTASGTILLAVKPQHLQPVCEAVAPHLSGQLVLSIAAGIPTAALSKWLGGYRAIVRVMPNTPAMVQKGISGLFPLPETTPAQRQQAQDILGAVGKTVWLEDEGKIDGVTAVSGSGPAYAFYFMEALEAAAMEQGFNAVDARALSVETFVGAALLAAQSPDSLAVLREKVTSKGGTTFAALESMRGDGVFDAIRRAVAAAADRSVELGKQLSDSGK